MNESHNRTPLPNANMEPAAGNEPLGAETLPRFDKAVHIHVTSCRKRKHDPDGISIKAVLDGLVANGILKDDSWDEIKSITFESRQSDEEKTVLEITDEKNN